jgi:hypothetical protein
VRKTAILLATIGVLFLTTQAAFADHKAGHYPPACGNAGKSLAGNSGQTCSQTAPGQEKKSFQFPREARGGSVTIGMLIIAGLGAFTVLLAARGVVRRRLIS